MISFAEHPELSVLLGAVFLSAIFPRRLALRWPLSPHITNLAIFSICAGLLLNRAAGLNKGDAVHAIFGLLMIGYFILHKINILLAKPQKYVPEIPLLISGFVFLTMALGFSDKISIWVGFLPIIILIALMSPRFVRGKLPREMVETSVKWSTLFLFVSGAIAALIFQQWNTLELSNIKTSIPNITESQAYSLILMGFIMAGFGVVSALPVLTREIEEAADWSAFSFFRGAIPLLSFWLIYRWVYTVGGAWSGEIFVFSQALHPQALLFGAAAIALIWALFQTFFPGPAIVFLPPMFGQALGLGLLGFARGDRAGTAGGILLSAMYVIATALFYRQAECVGICPDASVEKASAAARRSGFLNQAVLFGAALLCSPLTNYLGFSVLMEKGVSENYATHTQVIAVACGAALLAGIALLVGQLFSKPVEDSESDLRGNWISKIYVAILMAALIVLGIYPSPLYKYLIDILG